MVTENLHKLIDDDTMDQLVAELWVELDKFIEQMQTEHKELYMDVADRLYTDNHELHLVDKVRNLSPKVYKHEEEFITDLERVFREDYGHEASREFLEAASKAFHQLLSHFLILPNA